MSLGVTELDKLARLCGITNKGKYMLKTLPKTMERVGLCRTNRGQRMNVKGTGFTKDLFLGRRKLQVQKKMRAVKLKID